MNTQAERLRSLANPLLAKARTVTRWSGVGRPPSEVISPSPGEADLGRDLRPRELRVPSSGSAELRASRATGRGVGRLRIPSLALLSGQNGVGRTSLAIGLATELAASSRVALVDLDLERSDAPRDLGLEWEDAIGSVLRGQRPLGQALVELPSGLQVLSGGALCKELRGSGEVNRSGRSRLVSRLNDLEACVDVLTLDLACGWQTSTYELASAARLAVLVLTPEASAITTGYALLKRFLQDQRRWGPRFGVVVNGACRAEGERIGRGFAEVARRFHGVEVPLLGVIPQDPRVEVARAARRPFVTHSPTSPASQACARLANHVRAELSLSRAKESV